MRRIWTIPRRSKCQMADSRPLIENNNNIISDGCDQTGCDELSVLHEEPRSQQCNEEFTPQQLAKLLGVTTIDVTSEDGSCSSKCLETGSGQQNRSFVRLIQVFVSEQVPKPPPDLDQKLQQHLENVQETVCSQVQIMIPLLDRAGLVGCLFDCCHRQIFDHLNHLLQKVHCSQNYLVLMKWVLQTYLSQELLGRPAIHKMDPVNKIDLLLFTEWVEKAKDKLLESVQQEVRVSLEKILQMERSQDVCDQEEACVALYVDTIQCINAIPTEAAKISSKLSFEIREVCFEELLRFLGRYTREQTEGLGKKDKMDKPEMILFFKTLKTCKELKQHVQTKSEGIKQSILRETEATLENMEAFTLKHLKDIIADIAESHLKYYFKSDNKQFFFLIKGVTACFPKLRCCQDVQKRVMDEAYKLVTQTYVKHLVQSSQRKLTKHWSVNVGQTVTKDAKLLHSTFSELAPGVQQWNLMLLKISELLGCKSTDEVKLTVASMQKDCFTWSEDLDLLPALLQWMGLSGWQVREVLDALPGQQPRPASWYSYLTCW